MKGDSAGQAGHLQNWTVRGIYLYQQPDSVCGRLRLKIPNSDLQQLPWYPWLDFCSASYP